MYTDRIMYIEVNSATRNGLKLIFFVNTAQWAQLAQVTEKQEQGNPCIQQQTKFYGVIKNTQVKVRSMLH